MSRYAVHRPVSRAVLYAVHCAVFHAVSCAVSKGQKNCANAETDVQKGKKHQSCSSSQRLRAYRERPKGHYT